MLAVTGGLWEGSEVGGPGLSLEPRLCFQLPSEKLRAPATSEHMCSRPSLRGEGGWGHEEGSEVCPRRKRKAAVHPESVSLENDTGLLLGH